MVDKEIVLETVRKMYDSGIDDDVVEKTLRDIGLNSDEIKQYIAEAKGNAGPKPSSKSFEARMKAVSASSESPQNRSEMHSVTHLALEEQAGKMDELLKRLSKIEASLKSSKGNALGDSAASLTGRLASVENSLKEVRAELSATKTIMEKILETDRKVLNRV